MKIQDNNSGIENISGPSHLIRSLYLGSLDFEPLLTFLIPVIYCFYLSRLLKPEPCSMSEI